MGTNQRSQVEMTEGEIASFLERSRVATLATLSRDDVPHLVAMWYALIDGEVWFETKAKSQKAVNLRRNPRLSVLVEDGCTYDTLRGVSIDGHAEILDDPTSLMNVGRNVWERYTGPFSEEVRPEVEQMMNKRVVIRLVADRVRSWDHRKLALPSSTMAGTTAQYH